MLRELSRAGFAAALAIGFTVGAQADESELLHSLDAPFTPKGAAR